ncbi:MAG: YihY/virulence factor BrkB family protein [Treponema sp.]|nr:YihY/virulence factor BrkB family protein [Treponema sp.]
MKKKEILKATGSKFLLTFQLFSKNELANHAAAGAYGFFLSAAPALLLMVLLLSNIFRVAPSALHDVFKSFSNSYLGSFGILLDSQSLTSSFIFASENKFSGIITILNLLWTGRVFALSLQRGLRVIYPNPPGKQKPVKDTLIPFAIELAAIAYALLFIFSSREAILLFEQSRLGRFFPLLLPLLRFIALILPIVGLGLLTYGAYRFVPYNPPSRMSAFQGTLLAIVLYSSVSLFFQTLVNPDRYNLVYGALGNVVLLLANVYFFFTFFFLGAQFSYVINSFNALLFTRFRKMQASGPQTGNNKIPNFEKHIFGSPSGEMKKYIRSYEAGFKLFGAGETGSTIFYILSGSVGIYIQDEKGSLQKIAVLNEGNFIGEMAYLLSEPRTATAITESEAIIIELPPNVFEQVLQNDPETARYIIDSLSRRIKFANDKMRSL